MYLNSFRRVFLNLLLFTFSHTSITQAQILIKGKIIGAKDDKPVPFASVKILNSLTGCVADNYGNFLLSIKQIKKA